METSHLDADRLISGRIRFWEQVELCSIQKQGLYLGPRMGNKPHMLPASWLIDWLPRSITTHIRNQCPLLICFILITTVFQKVDREIGRSPRIQVISHTEIENLYKHQRDSGWQRLCCRDAVISLHDKFIPQHGPQSSQRIPGFRWRPPLPRWDDWSLLEHPTYFDILRSTAFWSFLEFFAFNSIVNDRRILLDNFLTMFDIRRLCGNIVSHWQIWLQKSHLEPEPTKRDNHSHKRQSTMRRVLQCLYYFSDISES